ncbi:MAG: aminotransferase class I/II-fold pyridoxal phosphate-dependent enzyme [Balneolaceae bacterium]
MKRKPETTSIHGVHRGKLKPEDPLISPEIRSTVFRHHPDHQKRGDQYTRNENPNRTELEVLIAALESGGDCATFSSGMAATAALFQSLDPGDHVLIPEDLYHGTRAYLNQFMGRWGLEVESADMSSPERVEDSIKPNTKLLWIETPSNPLLLITDIEALSKIAKRNNCLLAVDNTWPSPINTRPIEFGADLVMHSSTKYLGGHSDILGGAIIAKKGNEQFEKIRQIQKMGGSVPSPSDCWLMIRSIKTLPHRVKAHNENAMAVAEFLEKHSAIEKVFYPGLTSHEGHQTAKKQMSGFGGMLSFQVKGGAAEALKVVNGSQLIIPATSLGGVESTWEHRRSVESEGSITPNNLIRMSVGIEHIDDLIADLTEALS